MAAEAEFASLEDAKAAPFPAGCSFAFIPVDGGRYVHHSSAFGWEFHAGAIPLFDANAATP